MRCHKQSGSPETWPDLPHLHMITLQIKGMGPVPSFKNSKEIAIRPEGKRFLMTEKRVKAWMNQAIASFKSQLLCGSVTTAPTTLTAAQLRSLIASLPADDNWKLIPVLAVTSSRCEPGEEGAIITITPLR